MGSIHDEFSNKGGMHGCHGDLSNYTCNLKFKYSLKFEFKEVFAKVIVPCNNQTMAKKAVWTPTI